ncbi:MAG TPA: hypothetical protein VNW54_12895 [Granulicella sp.]|jgi:hypothetical protein|nr:hypothetical protein [Granulicella sp.]
MLVKMTNRNKINLAFILIFADWPIFRFNLSHAQYVGLFLFLLFAPKTFWVTFDAIASWRLRDEVLRSQERLSSSPEAGDEEQNEVNLGS